MRVRVAMFLVVLCLATAAFAQKRERKPIDELSGPELDALNEAFRLLKNTNPSIFIKWADIHGVNIPNKSGCQHNGEQLWPWHRAYLLEFENALRATNPPRTSNVTIPYWDWTKPPSGIRYPKAFENPTTYDGLQPVTCNPAQDQCNVSANCRIVCPNPGPSLNPNIIRTIQNLPTWVDYGGGLSFDKGQLESQAHDVIHGTYINGLNRNTQRAARDPLFWAHHSYMDKLWADWQDAHKGPQYDPVCQTCPINFLSGKTVGDYLSIAALGYSYAPPRALKGGLEAAQPPMAGILSRALPQAERVVEVPVPALQFTDAPEVDLTFQDVTIPTDASYLVKVYLKRAGGDTSRSESDLLTHFAMWRSEHLHGEEAESAVDVSLNVTERLQEMTAGSEPGRYVLLIEILRSDENGTITPVVPGTAFRWRRVEVRTLTSPQEIIR